MVESELWLPVKGWEGFYEVSDSGRVRSVDRVVIRKNGLEMTVRGRELVPWPTPPMGYLSVRLKRPGAKRGVRIHTLVLEAFVGPRPSGYVACHGPKGLLDNSLANLRWDTAAENIQDELRHGTHSEAQKTHCKRGHEFTPANTRMTTTGGRQCRECIRESNGAVERRGPYKSRLNRSREPSD